jgi:hypothetical protein
VATNSATGESDTSVADESNNTFTFLAYGSDPDLLSAITQVAARKTADEARVRFIDEDQTPTSTRTMAKMGKEECKWVDSRNTVRMMEGTGTTKLANTSPIYHARKSHSLPTYDQPQRMVCPDSGATSIMAPYRDMFTDYVDLQGKGLVVKLGNEDKTIPIAGRGTLAIQMQGHQVAYADALHVPDLSIILLLSRVHRRITQGCSFVADHSGCFLTYPTFSLSVDDTDDCTIPCSQVPENPTFEFDSRLFTSQHSSKEALRRSMNLRLQPSHRAWLAALRKSKAHLDPAELLSDPSSEIINTLERKQDLTSLPTRPVYSVPNSAAKLIKQVSSYDLKKMFGC